MMYASLFRTYSKKKSDFSFALMKVVHRSLDSPVAISTDTKSSEKDQRMSLLRFSSLLKRDFAAKYVLTNNDDKMMSGKYRTTPTAVSKYKVLFCRSTNPKKPAMPSTSIQMRPRTVVGFLKSPAAIATFALYTSRCVSRNIICICAGVVEVAINEAITTVAGKCLRARRVRFISYSATQWLYIRNVGKTPSSTNIDGNAVINRDLPTKLAAVWHTQTHEASISFAQFQITRFYVWTSAALGFLRESSVIRVRRRPYLQFDFKLGLMQNSTS